MKELRYHIYVNNECVSHSLNEDNFINLFDYYNDMSDHVTYEVVEVPQYQEASYQTKTKYPGIMKTEME